MLLFLSRRTLALFGRYSEQTLELWGYGSENRKDCGNPIAICEAAIVLFALWQWKETMRDCDVIWFIDNTVSLHSLVKCGSRCPYICRVVEAVHILMYRLSVYIWFEYVASPDNWADGITRRGSQDELCQSLTPEAENLYQDTWWWTDTLRSVWETPKGH